APHDFAPAAFRFDTEPCPVGAARAKQLSAAATEEVETEGETAIGRQFIALAILDDQVERLAAAFLGIAILVEAQVIDADRRPGEEAATAGFVGGTGNERHQSSAPIALDILLDRLASGSADERAAAAEVDESNGAPSEGAEPTPLASPVGGEFVGVRQNARLIVAVIVLVPEPSRARAKAADPGVDLGRCRKAETAQVVSCGLAFRLFAGPAAGADQHVDPAEKVNRTLRIGDLTRERASAKTHTFERSAGVIGKHLANSMAKLVAVGDPE